MAITMELRNLESYGGADSVAVLMLWIADPTFSRATCGADGFVVNSRPQRMRAAVRALLTW